jgi:hypothetical protein
LRPFLGFVAGVVCSVAMAISFSIVGSWFGAFRTVL